MSENSKGNSKLPIISYLMAIVAYFLIIYYYFPMVFGDVLNSISSPSWANSKQILIPLFFTAIILLAYFFASKSNINSEVTDSTKKNKSHQIGVFIVWLVRFLFVFSLLYYLFSNVITDKVIDLITKYPTPILRGIGMTILVSICSIVLGSGLGCLMAFILTSSNEINFIKSVVSSLIYVLLSIPALVIILVTYYSGNSNSIFLVSVFALSINLSPFVAKIIASSISNIPKNQIDAAKGFGFNKFKILRKFTIPFVIRHSLQPLLVEYYTTIKLSSLAGYIGLVEAFHTSQEIIKLEQDPLSAYIILTICYVILVAPIAIFADALEKWYRNKKTQL